MKMILIEGEPARHQFRVGLTPVALDLDGQVKQIQELSYYSTSWQANDAFPIQGIMAHLRSGRDLEARRCAEASLFRWFSISSVDIAHFVPGSKRLMSARLSSEEVAAAYLPGLVDLTADGERVQGHVCGNFAAHDPAFGWRAAGDVRRVRHPFKVCVSHNLGLVTFAVPVFQVTPERQIIPPDLELTACVAGQKFRYEFRVEGAAGELAIQTGICLEYQQGDSRAMNETEALERALELALEQREILLMKRQSQDHAATQRSMLGGILAGLTAFFS